MVPEPMEVQQSFYSETGAVDGWLQALPEAAMLIDPWADCVLATNAEARRLLMPGGSKLRSLSALFPDQLPQLVTFTERALNQGMAWTHELRCITDDGSRRRVSVQAGCLREGRSIAALVFLLRDLQQEEARNRHQELLNYQRGGLLEWQRVEGLFREIERENQLILRAAGEGIYGVDSEGRTTFLNPAGERMLGWRADEVAGTVIHNLIHHRHANGSEYPLHDCPIYAAFLDGKVHRVDDEVFWHRDGSPVHVEYTSTPIIENDKPVGAVVVFRDITKRLQADRELKSALAEVEALKRRLEMENQYLQEELSAEYDSHNIVGRSEAIRDVRRKIELVAPTDANVLITGESGTGKELIARAIHQASRRAQRPLIRVNCAAIPGDLFESEFFGHIKGAFTGAVSDRTGRFELADGGTLFLDEVGEIPLDLQGKLLRVLQEQQFERVGDSRTREVDVRVIAATNQDLRAAARERRFREDLYFRLNVFPIESVPLRDRPEDIPLLAQQFLQQIARLQNRPGLSLSMADIEQLTRYDWPGNVRELENVIERQVIISNGGRLQFDLPVSRESAPPPAEEGQARAAERQQIWREDQQQRQAKENARRALEACSGQVFGSDGAAALLGVKPTTLASRLKRWHIDPKAFRRDR